jgi:hypothetical protein
MRGRGGGGGDGLCLQGVLVLAWCSQHIRVKSKMRPMQGFAGADATQIDVQGSGLVWSGHGVVVHREQLEDSTTASNAERKRFPNVTSKVDGGKTGQDG